MKKLLNFTLVILLTTQVSVADDIKIYRQPKTTDMYFFGILGTVLAGAGFISIKDNLSFFKQNNASSNGSSIPGYFFMVVGGVMLLGAWECKQWDNLLSEPILILREDGFTYFEMCLSGKVRPLHYKWKDILEAYLEIWTSSDCVCNESTQHSRYWCLRIKDRDTVLKINQKNLVIERKMRDKLDKMFYEAMLANQPKEI